MSYVDLESGEMDELYARWYDCPRCQKRGALLREYRFCPYCGAAVGWMFDAETEQKMREIGELKSRDDR